MKTLLSTLIILTFLPKTFSQENPLLIGKWKTIEVNAENFSVQRNDSIVLPEKSKNRDKIALQNQRAHVRTSYSENIFVFTSDDKFYLYRNENPRTLIFDGSFKSQSERKIIFNLKNIAKRDVETTAEYYIKNGELYLKMYAEKNGPIDYVLTKVEN